MIKLNRRPPEPSYLRGPTVSKIKQELAEKIVAVGKLESDDFEHYWLNENVREPLWALHHGKCCYCERKREIKRESDVEHYRPKSMVTGADHPGYWWIAYEWTNYLFSCKPCNQGHKRNHFPLLPGSVRAVGPDGSRLSAERPVLLNPIDDDPETCISYDWWSGVGVLVKALGYDDNNRGSETIKILGLNRVLLMEERAEVLSGLQVLADSMIQARQENNESEVERLAAKIRDQTSAKRTFAGFRRAFFKSRELANFVADDLSFVS